jgi:hypothetical protein
MKQAGIVVVHDTGSGGPHYPDYTTLTGKAKGLKMEHRTGDGPKATRPGAGRRAACLVIQSKWTEAERARRAGANSSPYFAVQVVKQSDVVD